jgi:hypothetical protein
MGMWRFCSIHSFCFVKGEVVFIYATKSKWECGGLAPLIPSVVLKGKVSLYMQRKVYGNVEV